MPDFIKHVGRNTNGTRLVVVFREIPDDESFCLCVQTDSLPDMYHDQLLHEVNSRDAQATVDLFEVLQRRSFGDGGQMLNTLHSRGMLQKYAVKDITMMPMPNRPVSLTIVNEQIKTGTIASENKETVVDVKEKSSAISDTGVSVDTDAGLVKQTTVTPVNIDSENSKEIAEGKLLQARLLEEDAKKMREEAYALDPDLKKGGRPKKVKTEAEAEAEAK